MDRSCLAARWSVALLGLILSLDLFWSVVSGSTAGSEFGVIDEPAHIATALLMVFALARLSRGPLPPVLVGAALLASVAIDVDHIPGRLGWDELSDGVPRPYPHSFVAPALLIAAGAITSGRTRQIALGAALGTGAHLLRDLATGPGVALMWPASYAVVRVPYVFFAIGLGLAAALVLSTRLSRGTGQLSRTTGPYGVRSTAASPQSALAAPRGT